MADLNAMAQSVGGLRMEVTRSLKDANIHIRSFEYQDRGGAATDIMEQLDKLSKSAGASTASAGGLTLGPIDLDFSSLAAGLGNGGPETPFLREAKLLISQEKFREAHIPLDQAQAAAPGHHEAAYLKAYCYHKCQKPMEALGALAPLRAANLTNRLSTRVQVLRGEIRTMLLPAITEKYMRHIRAKDPAKAVDVLSKVTELDPAVGKYHFFLGSALVMARRYPEALRVVSNGLKAAESDLDELGKLRDQIDMGYVGQQLQPARKLYLEGKYAAARQAIEQLDDDCKQTELCRLFDKFLEKKAAASGGLIAWFAGSKPASGKLSVEQLDKVHSFLVREELVRAKQCVDANQPANAEQWLALAVRYVPEYPLANYLYAVRVYERIGAATKADDQQAGKLKRIDDLLGELNAAKKYAAIGAADARISEAPAVRTAIDQLAAELQKIRQEIETQENDARYVNRYADEFLQALLKLIEPGMNRNRAIEVIGRLRNLRDGISRDKHHVKSPQGKDLMQTLEQFARDILALVGQ